MGVKVHHQYRRDASRCHAAARAAARAFAMSSRTAASIAYSVRDAGGVDATSPKRSADPATPADRTHTRTVEQRHGQLREHHPGVMPLSTQAGGRHSLAQRGGQADPSGRRTNQHCTGMVGHTANAGHHQMLCGPARLHPKVPSWRSGNSDSTTAVSLARRALSRTHPAHQPVPTEQSGLGLAIVRQLAVRNDASVQLRPPNPTD